MTHLSGTFKAFKVPPSSVKSVKSPVELREPARRGRPPVIRRVHMLDPSRPVQVTNGPAGCFGSATAAGQLTVGGLNDSEPPQFLNSFKNFIPLVLNWVTAAMRSVQEVKPVVF